MNRTARTAIAAFLVAPVFVLAAGFSRGGPALPLQLLRDSGLALIFLLSVLGWGRLAFPASLYRDSSFTDRLTAQIVLGLTAVYILSCLLALGGLYKPVPLLAVIAIGALFSLMRIHELVVEFNTAAQSPAVLQREERWLLYAICILAGMFVVLGWTPLIFYDSLLYHLFAPSQFMLQGKWIYLPWNVYTNSPLALQVTLGTSLVLDREGQVCKVIITLISLLLVAQIAQLLKARRKAALLGAIFALTYPAFWLPLALGVFDLPLAAFGIFGTRWLRMSLLENKWPRMVPAAAALGMIVASRYQGVITVACVVLVLLVEYALRNGSRLADAFKKCLAAGAIVALLLIPWLARNWINTGNPVFPNLFNTLGGKDWSALQSDLLKREVLGLPFSELSAPNRILAPVAYLTMSPENGYFGFVLLLGALFALWEYRSFKELWLAGFLGLVCLVVWGLARPDPQVQLVRFNAMGIAFLLAAAAGMLTHPLFGNRSLLAGILLALGSLTLAVPAVTAMIPVLNTVTRLDLRNEFQKANVPGWPAFQFANEHLDPAASTALLLGESRGFWLKVPCISAPKFNAPQIEALFQPEASPSHWLQNFTSHGITHVVLNLSELRRMQQRGYMDYPPERMGQIYKWLQSQKVLFNDQHGNIVLELRGPVARR